MYKIARMYIQTNQAVLCRNNRERGECRKMASIGTALQTGDSCTHMYTWLPPVHSRMHACVYTHIRTYVCMYMCKDEMSYVPAQQQRKREHEFHSSRQCRTEYSSMHFLDSKEYDKVRGVKWALLLIGCTPLCQHLHQFLRVCVYSQLMHKHNRIHPCTCTHTGNTGQTRTHTHASTHTHTQEDRV